jgi:hypothetical protein
LQASVPQACLAYLILSVCRARMSSSQIGELRLLAPRFSRQLPSASKVVTLMTVPGCMDSQPHPGVLTAIHGADDGAIDDAHDATAIVSTVAARSSTCRKQPSTHPSCRRRPDSAATPLPLLGAARLWCGSACHRDIRTARGPHHRHGDGDDREIGAGVIHSSWPWFSDATSAGGVALNTGGPCQVDATAPHIATPGSSGTYQREAAPSDLIPSKTGASR